MPAMIRGSKTQSWIDAEGRGILEMGTGTG
jgi:hypothetical protein